MSNMPHFGVINADQGYTLSMLCRIFGHKNEDNNARQRLRSKLKGVGLAGVVMGRERFYTGSSLLMKLQELEFSGDQEDDINE